MERPVPQIFIPVLALVAGLIAPSVAPGPAVAAEPPALELEYEAYFGGFHVVSARTHIRRGDGRYEISGEARARGLLDWYAGWKGETVSRGAVTPDGTVRPATHDNEGLWRGATRRNSLVFKPDGTVEVEQESPPDPNKLTPIPEDSIADTVDPVSAIMSLAAAMEIGGSCDGVIPIYDGRRRYDLAVEQDGSRIFDANDYTIFAGEAVACRVTFEKIGGFRKEPSKYQKTARDRIVWVARPLAEAPPIPVRVDVETDFGRLIVHLTAARFGGEEIALAPGTDNLAD